MNENERIVYEFLRKIECTLAAFERLEVENAQLRELVRDMMRYYFMPSIIDSKQREAELLERASELGVEEDNGELVVKVDG